MYDLAHPGLDGMAPGLGFASSRRALAQRVVSAALSITS